jgi:hypothetical protein
MPEETTIEQIVEKAFEQMYSRYNDMLYISRKLKDEKDMNKIVYLLSVRQDIIDGINEINKTIQPIFDVMGEKYGITLNEFYENNLNLKRMAEKIKNLIMEVNIIDKEVMEYIKKEQERLQKELAKTKKTIKVNEKYKPGSKEPKIYDSRK